MASSTTSTVETDEVYFTKRAEVQLRIENNQIKAVDLYSLAPLLARWRSNDTFPVCLLCQTSVAEGEFGLGHLIPNSILKQCELKYFVDVNQGKESSVSRMGYRAFCSECEGRFSNHGEVNLNSKLSSHFIRTKMKQ